MNKGKWICPTPACSTAICSKQFQLSSEDHQQPNASSKLRSHEENLTPSKCKERQPTDNSFPSCASDEQSSLEDASPNNDISRTKKMQILFNPPDFLSMSLEAAIGTDPISTNAGVDPIDFTPHNARTRKYPTKLLLNDYPNILQRTKLPFWTYNSYKHFSAKHRRTNPSKVSLSAIPLSVSFPKYFLETGTRWSF